MFKNTTSRDQLKQAAACLDTATEGLAAVRCIIDTRIVTFEKTTEQWGQHPELPNSELRRWPAPAGAGYHMLEIRSPAGTYSPQCQISHDTDVHVLAGQILITRAGSAEQEFYGPNSCTHFAAQELHTCQILQDSHRLIIFHTPKPA